jgi:hypothetical protein
VGCGRTRVQWIDIRIYPSAEPYTPITCVAHPIANTDGMFRANSCKGETNLWIGLGLQLDHGSTFPEVRVGRWRLAI